MGFQKIASMMVWGCIRAHGMAGNLTMWEGSKNDQSYIQVLEQNMLTSMTLNVSLLYFNFVGSKND